MCQSMVIGILLRSTAWYNRSKQRRPRLVLEGMTHPEPLGHRGGSYWLHDGTGILDAQIYQGYI